MSSLLIVGGGELGAAGDGGRRDVGAAGVSRFGSRVKFQLRISMYWSVKGGTFQSLFKVPDALFSISISICRRVSRICWEPTVCVGEAKAWACSEPTKVSMK